MLNGDIHCNTYTYMNGYCASTIHYSSNCFFLCVVENPLDFKQEWVWIVQVVC